MTPTGAIDVALPEELLAENVDPNYRSLLAMEMSTDDWQWKAPAARCRECGNITWRVSLADGLRYLGDDAHRRRCEMPPSELEPRACAEY